MILHDWGSLPYEEARVQMEEIHTRACEDGQNHLILASHPACFTVGRDAWEEQWPVPVIRSDRGGSITCHGEGQNIYYFCFQSPYPARFFRSVRTLFARFFDRFDRPFYYDRDNPGFYIQNRKICSMGFRYRNGVSLHGVSPNVDIDLDFHNLIAPCALENTTSTSLAAEDIHIGFHEVNNMITSECLKVFDETL